MTKLEALQETKIIINERIINLEREVNDNGKSIFDSNFVHEVLYEGYNSETSFIICRIKRGQKTDILVEQEFKRIICLMGKIKIYIPIFNEETIMSSPNGILIPPNTEYYIEVMEDCEVIGVYKPRKEGLKEKIINKSIYTKDLKNE